MVEDEQMIDDPWDIFTVIWLFGPRFNLHQYLSLGECKWKISVLVLMKAKSIHYSLQVSLSVFEKVPIISSTSHCKFHLNPVKYQCTNRRSEKVSIFIRPALRFNLSIFTLDFCFCCCHCFGEVALRQVSLM